jgi:holo-ACP synthase/triphosphoribosyl-dephospho-CoA synthase
MIDLPAILAARDHRVQQQKNLLSQYGRPLVSFTMNIAGPVKRTDLIEEAFAMGCTLLEGQLRRVKAPILRATHSVADTGCEALYVVDLDARRLKELTVELEDNTPAGRLFDMDVIDTDGIKLDRPHERCCLICGKPGAGCARSRVHSVEELQARTREILEAALNEWDAETAARLACRALLYEVSVTPKPGLVDRDNSGSHTDMDIYTFFDSISGLYPYFAQCVRIGRKTRQLPPAKTLEALRTPGKLAENAMLMATGGVNTHKGAIFTLGVLCGALGRLGRKQWKEDTLPAQEAASMCRFIRDDYNNPEPAQRLAQCQGEMGARGQIWQGLPQVFDYGLPALEQALAQGKSKDEAGCEALLAIMLNAKDTNLAARGGMEAMHWAEHYAWELFKKESRTRADFAEMDRAFQERNLSPGGCADLLAVCWFVHFLKQE